ncbi:MAG: ABC transporter ATP-binding protein [Candidatus Zixiibacteriota bacterium]
MFSLNAVNLSRKFGQRTVFPGINLELKTGESIAITGPNGSGKSTLLKLLINLVRPTSGEVTHCFNGKILDESKFRANVSFVAPYLNHYDQLSGEENLQFFAAVRGGNITGKEIDSLLDKVGLANRGLDLVATYSTGMKQRLKYAVALSNQPQFLFLDEPMSALDDEGKSMVTKIIDEFRDQCIIVLATNEIKEYALGRLQCRLGQ